MDKISIALSILPASIINSLDYLTDLQIGNSGMKIGP